MLEFKLTIHDDGSDAKGQAKAIISALVAMYGEDIIPASYVRVGDVTRATGPITLNIAHGAALTEETKTAITEMATSAAEAFAPDGYPVVGPTGGALASGGEVERDKDGIPWDERVHASTKTKTAAGIWTRRRNLDDAIYNSVMAELRAANTARTVAAAQAVVPTPPAPTPGPSAAEAFQATPVPAPPPATPTPAVPGGAVPLFVQAVSKITEAQKAGKWPKPTMDATFAAVGLGGLGELAAASDDIKRSFIALVDAL